MTYTIDEHIETSEKLGIPENNVKRGSVTKYGTLHTVFFPPHFGIISNYFRMSLRKRFYF